MLRRGENLEGRVPAQIATWAVKLSFSEREKEEKKVSLILFVQGEKGGASAPHKRKNTGLKRPRLFQSRRGKKRREEKPPSCTPQEPGSVAFRSPVQLRCVQ